MSETPKVFVSSTLEDLGPYREAARDAILKLGWVPLMWEYFAAGGNPPLDTCLERVGEADVLLVIVAHRHGWTPPDQSGGDHKSITRVECECAERLGKKVIPFRLDDHAPWDGKLYEMHRIHEAKPSDIERVAAEVGGNVRALGEFKIWLDDRGARKNFSSPAELGWEVQHALIQWVKSQGVAEAVASNASVRVRYLEWLRRTCETVELLGLDLKDSQNVRLNQVYVPAITAHRGAQAHDLLLHRLGEGSLYVPGAPGAGKSTFCRWVALVMAGGDIPAHPVETPKEYLEQLPVSLRGRFPLLCRLREWGGYPECLAGNGQWLRKELEDSLARWIEATKPGELTPEIFRDELARGRCLLILDGVDEVPEKIGAHLPRRNLLTGLADALPEWLKTGNRILLTSRPYGLDNEDRRRLGLIGSGDQATKEDLAKLANLPDELQQTFARLLNAAGDITPTQADLANLPDELQQTFIRLWNGAGDIKPTRGRLANLPNELQHTLLRRWEAAANKPTQADLADLPDELRHTFIRRWYAAVDPARASEKSNGLIRHLQERRDLDELRPNPMLLTALCVKYDEGQRLPQDFYRLYEAVVNQVLHKRYFVDNERDRARLRLAAIALAMHAGSKGRPKVAPEAEVSIDELDRSLAEFATTDWTTEDGGADAAARREDLLSNSGLLLPRAGRRAAFYHLSFQEFFAAVRLRRIGEHAETILQRHAATPAWRRTLTFMFCAIADQESNEAATQAYEKLLQQIESEPPSAEPNRALLLADCVEVAHARGWNLARLADSLRGACAHAAKYADPPARARLWRTLGRLGLDDRRGVGAKDGLPDIDWCDVPSGEFLYGNDRKKRTLPAYRIARYLVTNAQFQCFIDDRGYDADAWWQGLQRRRPERPSWDLVNHPRETVSWCEAMAFCKWLTARQRAAGNLGKNKEIRLPTEQEWERAARGTDGRAYPWGDRYQAGRANINETWEKLGPHNLQRTSAVGIYPQGQSPCCALDMVGNVLEWCLNARDEKSPSVDAPRALRGGSWLPYHGLASSAHRLTLFPDVRNSGIGFRLCCSPSIK